MSRPAIPVPMHVQAAALARDWQDYVSTSATARHRAAMLARTRRAMSEPRSELLPSILKVLETRPKQWWQAGDIVEPLKAHGWTQTATQIGHALRRGHQRGQVERKEAEEGRRVMYRIKGEA